MPNQPLVQNSELKEALNRIEITLKIRAAAFILFLSAILIFGWLGLLHYTHHTWLIISALVAWPISAFVVQALAKKKKTVAGIYYLYFIYSALFEFGFLTILVFTNGGLLWIGTIFYLFIIICSNMVLPKLQGHSISFIAFLWLGGATWLQYFKIIPFLSCFMFNESMGDHLTPEYILATLCFALIAFVLSGFASNALTDVLKKRTKELEKTKSQLEEAKIVLEVRVRARTRELKEIAESLDGQVKERTEELEENIKDLRRFQNISVDRELKMIELKKEIKKLKDADLNPTEKITS